MSDKTVNTMIELTKTNKITFGVITVLLVLILGFLFLNPTKYTFNTNLNKELADVRISDYQVTPQEFAKKMIQKDQNLILVDIRSQFDFAKNHLPEAKNIYSVNLMEDANIDFFKGLKSANKHAILYGNTAAEANIPFMILKQMGIENIFYLNAGYDVVKDQSWDVIAANTQDINDENPVIDFAQFIKDANSKIKEGNLKQSTEPKFSTKPKEKIKVMPKATHTKDEGC